MQHARIYRALLPSEIFPKYGNVVERKKTIVNRLQRATKRGKFWRAAWEFDVVCKPETKGNPRGLWHRFDLLNFAPALDNFKNFQWTRNSEVLKNIDCEQSLFGQSRLSSAGLERANWPRGELERGGKKRDCILFCNRRVQISPRPQHRRIGLVDKQ